MSKEPKNKSVMKKIWVLTMIICIALSWMALMIPIRGLVTVIGCGLSVVAFAIAVICFCKKSFGIGLGGVLAVLLGCPAACLAGHYLKLLLFNLKTISY